MTITEADLYEARPASPVLGAEIVGVDLTERRRRGDCRAPARGLLEVQGARLPRSAPDAGRARRGRADLRRAVRPSEVDPPPRGQPSRVHVRPREGRQRRARGTSVARGANPPFNIESLSYQVVPEVGGRTLWADLQAAYDGLSEPFKQLLESVSAVYNAYPGRRHLRPPAADRDGRASRRAHPPPHRPQGAVPQLVGAAPDRHRAGRGRRAPAVPAGPCRRRRTTRCGSAGSRATSSSGTTRPPGTSPSTTTTARVSTARSSAADPARDSSSTSQVDDGSCARHPARRGDRPDGRAFVRPSAGHRAGCG